MMDQVINLIKEKDDNLSYFSLPILYQFELRFLLCMDIIRFELQTNGRISDTTADAMSQLFTFGAFEYYYRDFRYIHEKCTELFNKLTIYNQSLKNNDLPGEIAFHNEKWSNFFSTTITHLLR